MFADTALAITVRDVFGGPGLIVANSWLESANQSGQIIGPTAAGLLAAAGLLHVSMLIDAASFLVSLATLAVIRRPGRHADRASARPGSLAGFRRELADGLRYLGATRLLLTLLVFMLVLNLCLGADKLIIFLGRTTMHLPAAQVGLIVAARRRGRAARRGRDKPAGPPNRAAARGRAQRGRLGGRAHRDRNGYVHAGPPGSAICSIPGRSSPPA